MNILSDKFCSWVIGGNSPIYWCTPLPAFFDLCEKNYSKTPLTKLTILPLLNQPLTFSHTQSHCCVEFETEMTMPPRHIHSVSSIHDPPEFKFILPLLPPSTLFFVKLHPFNVCQYTSKSTHRALNVGFIHRFGMCFFSDCFPWICFSQSETEEYAGLLYIPPSIFLIMYCMETFVITYDYLSHHCRKDYLKYKGSFEQNALLLKGHYPFSVDLRPGINWLCSDGCCM